MADHRHTKRPSFYVRQCVWLSTRALPVRSECRKLSPRFLGPFPISEGIIPVRLKVLSSVKVTPTFHVSHVNPCVESPLKPVSPLPLPPPHIFYSEPVYTVKKLLAVRIRGRGRQYLVDWEEYSPEEQSWVSFSNILDPDHTFTVNTLTNLTHLVSIWWGGDS